MGQNLAKTSATAAPAMVPKQFSQLVDKFRRKIEPSRGRYMIADTDQPTADERRMLAKRRAELTAALRPGHPAKIAAEALKLFDGWPSMRMDDHKAADTGLAYSRQIEWAPIWAIVEACAVCQGRNSAWPPSSGQFRAEVIAKTAPLHVELREIERILDAEAYHRLTQSERDKAFTPETRALLQSLGVKLEGDVSETFHPSDDDASATRADHVTDPTLTGEGTR